jgi:hypothetical protein
MKLHMNQTVSLNYHLIFIDGQNKDSMFVWTSCDFHTNDQIILNILPHQSQITLSLKVYLVKLTEFSYVCSKSTL